MSTPEAIQVSTTCSTQQDAERLAASVIDERLAACAQLEPILSLYHWNGAVQRDAEVRISFKTRADLFTQLAARIRELSSYQTPQIIALPIVAADAAYLAWIRETTAADAGTAEGH